MCSLRTTYKHHRDRLSAWLAFPGFLFARLTGGSKGFKDPEFFQLNDALVAEKVMNERVRVFADRSFEGALTSPLGIFLLAWVGSSAVGWRVAMIWFVVFTALELIVMRVAYLYRRESAQTQDARTRASHLVILSLLVGLGWGSSVWVFSMPGHLDSYLLNLLILVGAAAFSLLTMSPFLSATAMFFAGLLLLPMLHSLLSPGLLSLQISAGLGIMYALMLQYGTVAGQQLVRDIESTVRNGLLAERLRLALEAARQDWFDLNPQSGEMIASTKYTQADRPLTPGQQSGLQDWLGSIHPEDLAALQLTFGEVLHAAGATEAEYRVRTGGDGWRWVRSVGRVVDRDQAGNPQRVIGIHSDITERKRVEEHINRLAFYDQLTGLPNRRLLNDRLQHAVASAARHRRHGALMLLDMDDFKALNDAHGHDVGDRFLQEVATRLQSCVRGVDTVARLGGDEFVVILEDLDAGANAVVQAEKVATKILESIRQPFELDLAPVQGRPQTFGYHCTVSVGIAMFSEGGLSPDELLKRADTAMYRAKANGRNAIRFFDPDMQAQVTARAILDNELREAVRARQFVLYYQPQVDGSGCVRGAEALIRWLHPARGVVTPDAFISVLEATGLIQPVGRWVLESACDQLVAWAAHPATSHLTLSVNVSAMQFEDHDFTDHLLASVERTGADPNKLKLEITESLLLNNADDIIDRMAALQARGVGFLLDDFGTGYSSLSYLKRLPIEQLKIDKSFVRDVLTDANDAAIARTIVALANSMGLSVVAEGVETEEQRQFLAANGCHAYQGYYFGRPVPIDRFEREVIKIEAS